MTLTVTALPSPADTHGSHSPNVITPLFSTAPSAAAGNRFRAIFLQGFPLESSEQDLAGMSLQANEARLLGRGGQTTSWGLGIAGEVEPVHDLAIERDCEVSSIDRDFVLIPLS